MIDVGSIIYVMVVLMLMVLLGVILGKLGMLDGEFRKKLARLIINVTQCCLIISSSITSGENFRLEAVWQLLALSVAAHFILYVIGVIFSRLVRAADGDRGTYKYMATFGNVTFIGIPVIRMIFGETGVLYAAVFILPFNFASYSIGVVMLAGRDAMRLDWKTMITPPFVGSAIALAITILKIPVPEVVAEPIYMVGNITIPSAALILGSSLADMSLKNVFGEWRLYLMLPVRLILAPAAVFFAIRVFTSDPVLLGTATMMAAMPVALNSTMLSIRYGGNERIASSGVFMTTLLSVVSVPLVYRLLLAGFV